MQGGEHILGQDEAWVGGVGMLRFIDNGIGAAFLQGCGGKLVAIEGLSFEGEEDGALGTVAAVGSDDGMLLKNVV